MPELPEVETVKNDLKQSLIGEKIKNIEIFYPKLIEKGDVNLLKGHEIQNIKRRGKWLIFIIDNLFCLVHLRMEGKFFYQKDLLEPPKYTLAKWSFLSENCLFYTDFRKFGKMQILESLENSVISCLGVEPFSPELNEKYLAEKFAKSQKTIKALLLDQEIIAGIGNIYADEILFQSHINPQTKAKTLKTCDLSLLISKIQTILKQAINEHGTSIRSFSSLGQTGNFQNFLKIKRKKGQLCEYCKHEILTTKISGRMTYFCPNCQK